jgi:hypothetical protein
MVRGLLGSCLVRGLLGSCLIRGLLGSCLVSGLLGSCMVRGLWVTDGTDDFNEWRVRAYERSSPEKLCCLMGKRRYLIQKLVLRMEFPCCIFNPPNFNSQDHYMFFHFSYILYRSTGIIHPFPTNENTILNSLQLGPYITLTYCH